ncbi:MAG: hypothetical protein R3294_12920 [Arenibacter troitsensis]|nr:hypothetical protein [Arenibacter troitsensis]|tara:strand:- start:593 stop:973 length:381 start_codon:yes stop_codon:yes gene_type:complete
METNLTDSQKILDVIHALGTSAHAFAIKMKYKSHSSVDHVIKGRNSLSEGMMDRIVKTFPNVSYNFLKKGELPILLTSNEIQAQMDLLNIAPKSTNEFYKIKRMMEVPEQLDRIERKLDKILGINR